MQLFQRSQFKRYFFNTAWAIGERSIRLIVVFIVGVIVARYLGPKKLGILNYAISFVGLFSEFATLGLDRISVRELVRFESKRADIMGTVFWLRVIGAVSVLCLILIIIAFLPDDLLTKSIVALVALTLLPQAFLIIDFYFQAKVLMRYIAFAKTFQLVISSTLKIFLVLIKAPLIWFAVTLLIDSLSLAIGLIYFFVNSNTGLRLWDLFRRFDKYLAKQLLLESWPLVLSGLVVSIYMKIDQVMLKEMLNSAAVGQYAVAVRLSETWYFIPGLLLQALFPAIVTLRQEKNRYYQVRLQQLHDFLTIMAFLIAIFMSLFAHEIIAFLFGPQFMEAASILVVHIWAGLFVFPGNVRAHLIILEKKQKIALVFRSIGALTNVILNLILIPRFGPVGAAWATLASYTLPVYFIAFFDPLIRSTIIMTFKSYLFPFRLILYRKAIYEVSNR